MQFLRPMIAEKLRLKNKEARDSRFNVSFSLFTRVDFISHFSVLAAMAQTTLAQLMFIVLVALFQPA
jgi:hypothetical protein